VTGRAGRFTRRTNHQLRALAPRLGRPQCSWELGTWHLGDLGPRRPGTSEAWDLGGLGPRRRRIFEPRHSRERLSRDAGLRAKRVPPARSGGVQGPTITPSRSTHYGRQHRGSVAREALETSSRPRGSPGVGRGWAGGGLRCQSAPLVALVFSHQRMPSRRPSRVADTGSTVTTSATSAFPHVPRCHELRTLTGQDLSAGLASLGKNLNRAAHLFAPTVTFATILTLLTIGQMALTHW